MILSRIARGGLVALIALLSTTSCAGPEPRGAGVATPPSAGPGAAPDERVPDRVPEAPHDTRRVVADGRTTALWVDTWNPGLFTPAECDALIDFALDHGFDTLIVEARKTGDAYYTSALEPRGVDPRGGAWTGDFDPLAYLVEHGKRARGFRIEAWVVAQRIWKGARAPAASTPPHVVNAHPDWLLRRRNGGTRGEGDDGETYLDPSSPGARAWNAQVVGDIARRYAVDAIHLDYIRYPGEDWGYGEDALARYRRDTGARGVPAPTDAAFTRWRAGQVTQALREMKAAARAARPGIEITAATLIWGKHEASWEKTAGYHDAFQDWPSWCATGLLDRAYPMLYKREADPVWRADFRAWLTFLERLQRETPAEVVVGLGAWMNAIDEVAAQARAVWSTPLEGIAVFSYASPHAGAIDRAAFGAALRRAIASR